MSSATARAPWPFVVALACLAAACSDEQALTVDAGPDRTADRDSALSDSVAARPDSNATVDAGGATIDAGGATDSFPMFPPGPAGCMGTQGQLSHHGSEGDLAVYSGCKTLSGSSSYLLVKHGTVASLTQPDLSGIVSRNAAALLKIAGINGIGITACCVPSSNNACLYVDVATNTLSVWELAAALSRQLQGEPDCVGIVADVPGASRPRCEPDPVECLPIPICDTAKYYNPGCCTVPPYNAAAERTRTLTPGSSEYFLEQPQSPGECTHDGECVLNGCGTRCVAYTAPSAASTCLCYPGLKDSFCGCVAGQCVWYEQR